MSAYPAQDQVRLIALLAILFQLSINTTGQLQKPAQLPVRREAICQLSQTQYA